MTPSKTTTFEQFIDAQSEEVGEMIMQLNDLFLSYPHVGMKIRFHIPFYDYNTWICYLNPLKNQNGLELVFLKGKELQKIFPFLEDNGRKMVAGIQIIELSQELMEEIIMVWEEALLIV